MADEAFHLLAQTPLFDGFDEPELAPLMKSVRRRKWPRDSYIFREGDPGTDLYVIGAGEIKISRTTEAGTEIGLAVLRSIPKKTFIVGVLNLADSSPVETVEMVVERIKAALRHVSVDRLLAAPDCGMKYLPRTTAFAKLQAMVAAAERVRVAVL